MISAIAFPVTLKPTTTITAETSNNTSAALPATLSNGNVGATNTSNQSLRTLLPAGSTAQIIAVYQPWFRLSYHMEIGYDEHTTAQVQKQVEYAQSRGITGFMVNWYGQPINSDKKFMDDVTILVRQQAEAHPGFTFALQYDGGAFKTWTGDKTQKMIDDLNYAASIYFTSPAYMRKNGRPIVEMFSIDESGPVDWDRIRAGVQGNPLFIHRNGGGFTHVQSDGAFGWVGINATWTTAVTYNDSFYKAALANPGKVVIAPAWTGFNDTLASWGQNRIAPRACGQVWLKGWAQARQYYPAGNFDYIELNTWNDYEEGTELESGVDDCNTITASVSGDALSWSVTGGTPSAIDHYEVYATLDGNNAAMLASVAAGNSSIDLAQFSLDAGNYQIYVKSVGEPGIINHMSNAAAYKIGNSFSVSLGVTPASGIAPLPVTAAVTSSVTVGSIASTTINFGDGTVVNAATATHTYAAAGTYTVTATSTDSAGNQKAATQTVTISANQPPVAALSLSSANGVAPALITASTAGSTDADGTIASSSINFGDGTVVNASSASHTYAAAGTYTVTATVTDNKGGKSSASSTVKLTGPAVTITSPASGAATNSLVHFVASAAIPTGRTVSSMAVVVDGKTAYSGSGATLDANVAVTPGAHSATVQATDNTGAVYSSGAVALTATNLPPSASLAVSGSSASTGQAVTATVTASDADGSISAYSINFGDGFVATTTSASHAYATAGTYTVTATVTDNNGAKATSSAAVTVVAPGIYVSSPAAGATVGSPVHFVVNAVANAGQAINLTRIYVDGVNAYQISGSAIDTNLTLSGGTHNLNIQAWDGNATLYKTTLTVTVPVNQPPTVALSLSSSNVVTGAVLTAKVTASDPDGTIASYSVDFGDGTVVTTSSASHAFSKAGTYTVTATATDNKGAKKSTTKSVKVVVPGVYVTTAAQGSTAGSSVHFVASTMPQAGRTVSMMRIYVDGVSKYQVNAASLNTYVTMSKGTHNVVVQAWDTLNTTYKAPLTITAR